MRHAFLRERELLHAIQLVADDDPDQYRTRAIVSGRRQGACAVLAAKEQQVGCH
jgi:hypothetical protein